MLSTGFGVPISYLSIGKETLWLVFSCLMAFMAFRFGFASVRAFALGQVAYFLASTAGWAIGALVAPFYDDPMVRMAVGAVMAFVVVLVLTLLFTDRDIKAILLAPVAAVPSVLTRCPATTEASCVGCTAADNATADEMEGAGASGEGAPRTPGRACFRCVRCRRRRRCRGSRGSRGAGGALPTFGRTLRSLSSRDRNHGPVRPRPLRQLDCRCARHLQEHGALASTSYLHEARCAHAPRTSRLP